MYLILFDIDGTLIKTGGAGQVAFFDTIREDFGISELPQGVPFAGRSDRAIAEEILRLCEVPINEETWEKFRTGYLGRLNGRLESCSGSVLPGVIELLDQLGPAENVCIGLLTGNIEEGAKTKLIYYGLWDRFAFGGYGDIRTERNDIAADAQQAGIDYLASRNGHTIKKVMVIGDTQNDVICARSIDAYAVAVCTGGASREELTETQPDLLLDDLADSERLLEEITSVVGPLTTAASEG